MKKSAFTSIILPTYNEAGNITPLINNILKQLHPYPIEIIVVDDDSPDQTAKLVEDNFKKNTKVKLFVRTKNKGLAKAILYGIKKSKGNYLLVMDTDFNHHPNYLPTFLNQRNKADLLIGSRYIKGGGMENKTRYYLSFLYNKAIRRILKFDTFDNLSGFFLIDKNQLKKFDWENVFQGYGDYFIRLIKEAHRFNLKIKEIPVFYQNRMAGKSKSRFFSMFISYSQTVLNIFFCYEKH